MKRCSFLILFLFLINNAFCESRIVSSIIVNGNDRIDSGYIINYLKLKKGSNYDTENVNKSLKSLYETGFFKTVDISFDSGKLNVKVEENPLITDIVFDGNDDISEENLLSEITSAKRSIFNKNKLSNDVKRILTLYKRSGKFLATVEPKIVDEGNNRIKVIFEIKEGKSAKIKNIYFIGANKYSEDKLKSIIISKENSLFTFSGEEYDPDRIEYDKEFLRRFYLSNGYADFEVLSSVAEIDRENKYFNVTFLIEEGEKYTFGEIEVTNNIKKVKTEKIEKVVTIKSDKIFNADLIQVTIDNLIKQLAKDDFVFVDINPLVSKSDEKKTISVNFIINKTAEIYVGEVKINGNTRTHDDVIRREMRLEEGDPFSSFKLNRSVQRLQNIGYFEKVEIQQFQGIEPNIVNLIVNVKERRTGEINFGVGYSTIDGMNVNMGIKENNLLGRGVSLGFNVTYAKYAEDYTISYEKPRFLDRNLYAGFNIFYHVDERKDNIDYQEKTVGGGFSVSYDITEYLSQRLSYSIYKDTVENVNDTYQGIIEERSDLASVIGQTLYYDRRDSKIDPMAGFYSSYDIKYAGIGGDKHYMKNVMVSSLYIPIFPSYVTLKIEGRGGIVNSVNKQPLEPVDGFYIGGNILKGFSYAGVGPRKGTNEKDAKDKNAVGGSEYWVFNTELRVPLGLPREYGIYGVFFYNEGTVTGIAKKYQNRVVDSGSTRSAYGFYLFWRSPMAPLTFTVSKALRKETYDQEDNLAFSFSTNF